MEAGVGVEVARRRFDVEEYHRMAEAGILRQGERVELIEGEIVEMTPIGWRHVRCVNRLNMLLGRSVGDRYVVSVQNPVVFTERGELQPDLVLHEEPPRGRLPAPQDVFLVVEVADTSLAYDREVKLPFYARFGIPEAWLVDLNGDVIEVHSRPSPEGYRQVGRYLREEPVVSPTVEGLSIPADDILG